MAAGGGMASMAAGEEGTQRQLGRKGLNGSSERRTEERGDGEDGNEARKTTKRQPRQMLSTPDFRVHSASFNVTS